MGVLSPSVLKTDSEHVFFPVIFHFSRWVFICFSKFLFGWITIGRIVSSKKEFWKTSDNVVRKVKYCRKKYVCPKSFLALKVRCVKREGHCVGILKRVIFWTFHIWKISKISIFAILLIFLLWKVQNITRLRIQEQWYPRFTHVVHNTHRWHHSNIHKIPRRVGEWGFQVWILEWFSPILSPGGGFWKPPKNTK